MLVWYPERRNGRVDRSTEVWIGFPIEETPLPTTELKQNEYGGRHSHPGILRLRRHCVVRCCVTALALVSRVSVHELRFTNRNKLSTEKLSIS